VLVGGGQNSWPPYLFDLSCSSFFSFGAICKGQSVLHKINVATTVRRKTIKMHLLLDRTQYYKQMNYRLEAVRAADQPLFAVKQLN
jgi:hypothetical protein